LREYLNMESQGGIHVIPAPDVKSSVLLLAPAAPVSPFILLTTCTNIERIGAVSAPLRQRNELPAPDKSLLYSMDSTLDGK
jgi:hypothetical protein